MKPYVCIHGHFYQPPRENPWLGEVEIQDSAYPFHDWNKRISAECYAPNSAARILEGGKDIVKIVNNYARMSFNFGPTLLTWLEKHESEVYLAILEADKQSQRKFSGHGSAIAQAYNHMIMPLADSRDRHTQVSWGIQDFIHRFEREPEGMWLPETAVDLETLEILAHHGIQFTILSPLQALRIRKIGQKDWIDVKGSKVDTKKPYSVPLPSGGEIAVFFYDGAISHGIAFGDLLKDGELFSKKLLKSFSPEQSEIQMVHVATDGESYGHHHRFGEMALAYCLDKLDSATNPSLTVYGEYLEMCPPKYEVEIKENSSWSCAHGVERWRSDCGCNTGRHPKWTQAWRAPLREAMDWLRDQVAPIFEKEMAAFFKHPWEARDDYIKLILDRSEENVETYFSKHLIRSPSQTEKVKILNLLELERNAMLMFTSCGWFFDEISGIETVQIMKYAGRTIQLAREINGKDLEHGYIDRIEKAPSNHAAFGNGAKVYEQFVKPASLDPRRIGVHYAVSSLFEDYSQITRIGEFTAQSQFVEHMELSSNRLALGKVKIRSETTWDEETISYAVLHYGDQNLIGGARRFSDEQAFSSMKEEMASAFQTGDVLQIIQLMDLHFEGQNYSLWHLLRDKKREILDRILKTTLADAEASLRLIFENHYSIMSALKENNIPLPKAYVTSVEFILDADFRKLMEGDDLDLGELRKIIQEFEKWDLHPDSVLLGYISSFRLNKMMVRLQADPKNVGLLGDIETLLLALKDFPVDLDLWKSQNIYFALCRQLKDEMAKRRNEGDSLAENWIEKMRDIGHQLQVKCW